MVEPRISRGRERRAFSPRVRRAAPRLHVAQDDDVARLFEEEVQETNVL
jgi:hypothetical protein